MGQEERVILEETREPGFFAQFSRQLAGPDARANRLVTVAMAIPRLCLVRKMEVDRGIRRLERIELMLVARHRSRADPSR